MIVYDKLIGFCNKNKLKVEEYALLHSVYLRQYEFTTENSELMNAYYSFVIENGGIKYVELGKSLIERGYLLALKPIEDTILLKNLIITDKYLNTIFVKDKEQCWKEFVNMYPKTGSMDKGMSFFDNANKVKTSDERNFYKHVLKNNTSYEWSRVVAFMESYFVDQRNYAPQGISNFILNWDKYVTEWEEDNKKETRGNWNTKSY